MYIITETWYINEFKMSTFYKDICQNARTLVHKYQILKVHNFPGTPPQKKLLHPCMPKYDFPRGGHYDPPPPLDARVAFYPLDLQGLSMYVLIFLSIYCVHMFLFNSQSKYAF